MAKIRNGLNGAIYTGNGNGACYQGLIVFERELNQVFPAGRTGNGGESGDEG